MGDGGNRNRDYPRPASGKQMCRLTPHNNRLQTDESGACREELVRRLATRSDTLAGNPRAGLAAEASVRWAA
jgi:hypothetical protein